MLGRSLVALLVAIVLRGASSAAVAAPLHRSGTCSHHGCVAAWY